MTNNRPIQLFFTDFWHPTTVEQMKNNSLYLFLSKHFELELSENPDFLFYSCFGSQFLNYKCVRIFYTGENIRPRFKECDFALSFDYPETDRNFRLPLYRLYPEYNQLPCRREPTQACFDARRFCCFLYSNPRPQERIHFFEKLSKYKKVDSGGMVKNNMGYNIIDNIEFMSNYKFSVAFENSKHPGYTTEKILHAFVANTIPIYWGNPKIHEDFNTRAFINCHEYDSFEQVVDVVREIDQDKNLYMQYLSQPIFPDGVENKYCQEKNIIDNFGKIFSSTEPIIPPYIKSIQSLTHKARLARNKIKNIAFRPS